jgi:hypothetical protein
VRIDINTSLAQDFVPHVRINPIGVFDPQTFALDRVLRKHLGENINVIKQAMADTLDDKHPLRMRQIVSQMRDIAYGKKDRFYLFFRKQSPISIPVDKELQKAFQHIVRIIDLRLLLFEDLVPDISPNPELISERDELHPDDYYEQQNTRINLHGKVRAVKRLVLELGEKRGLIFCRNLEICEYLAGVFIGQGHSVSIIHSRIDVPEQQERIRFFKRHKKSMLLMTRYAGLRGFDIPEADYAIFYSPKDQEEVMWQEISRIRSTIKDPKEIYILYYKGTGEEDKYNRLLWHMRGRNRYLFSSKKKGQEPITTDTDGKR